MRKETVVYEAVVSECKRGDWMGSSKMKLGIRVNDLADSLRSLEHLNEPAFCDDFPKFFLDGAYVINPRLEPVAG